MNKKYKLRSNSCIIQGDTHSISIIFDTIKYKIPDGSDYFQIGDGGFGFGQASFALDNAKSWLHKINKLCVEKNINCYLLIGNHDNPAVWKLPPEYSNLFLVQSGEYAEFPNGKTAILVGGGISVDRCVRCEGIDYWSGEPTPVLRDLKKCDIMFSHDCPEYFNHSTNSLGERFQWAIDKDPLLIDDCNAQRINMTYIVEDTGIKTLFYGHYHNSTTEEYNGVYGRCVNINDLVEFDADETYAV